MQPETEPTNPTPAPDAGGEMDRGQEIIDAIHRAGYGVAYCRLFPRGNWYEVMLDWHSPKKKWFGVLKRKLARQGLTQVMHYGATSQYIEYLMFPATDTAAPAPDAG